jgi:S-adenosylmethionine:tRNA ribosyltransferase-isomerase
MHPKNLEIKDYTYKLPDDRIARFPLQERDQSKLLVFRDSAICEGIYKNIATYLPSDSLVVFNNTKVIHARLFFETASGAKVEVFCLEPTGDYVEMASAMSATRTVRWKCMIGRASKWKEKILHKKISGFELTAELVDRTSEYFVVEFTWQPENLSFAEILDKAGVMPIPPYLKRESGELDLERYQTVYAKYEGSVAAPTAGLHFTSEVLKSLKEKNIKTEEVTLHVGAGTFKPVKAATMSGHDMHAELIDVSLETIEQLLANKDNIVAVGTTTLRTVESLFWMGGKVIQNPHAIIEEIEIKQWDPYDAAGIRFAPADALTALLAWMMARNMRRLVCKTQILIAPPYKVKLVKALVTNFHQPNSTLLLLVAAVVGDKWQEIYDYALGHDFRFLSYGDGSLLYAR